MGQDSKSTQISSLGGREGKKLEYRQGKKSLMKRMVDLPLVAIRNENIGVAQILLRIEIYA